MTRGVSLTFRFLMVVTVIAVVALGGTGIILVELFRQEIARQVETRLSSHLDRLSLLVELKDGRPALREPPLEPRFNERRARLEPEREIWIVPDLP